MKTVLVGSWLMLAVQTAPDVIIPEISDDVPPKVKTAFAAKFPNITDVSWDIYGKEFVASFEDDGNYTEVTYLADGVWVETSVTLNETELPEEIAEQIEEVENFEYYNSILLIEKPGVSTKTLSVSFDTDDQTITMLFNEDGQLLSKEVEDF